MYTAITSRGSVQSSLYCLIHSCMSSRPFRRAALFIFMSQTRFFFFSFPFTAKKKKKKVKHEHTSHFNILLWTKCNK